MTVALANAQTNDLFIISTSGESVSSSAGYNDYTIGEVITETVASANWIITQGFQQSNIETGGIISGLGITNNALEVDFYPNPFNSLVTVTISESTIDLYNIDIIDLRGRTVFKKSNLDSSFNLDLQILKPSMYFLRITGKNNKTVEILKITKYSDFN